MAGKAICKETIKKNTKQNMQKLGVYKAEYEDVIDIYSELMEQYTRLTKRYKESNFKICEYTASGGEKKSPIVATIEGLRRDILQYSDRLCLNPKANQVEIKGKGKRRTPLSAVIEEIEK